MKDLLKLLAAMYFILCSCNISGHRVKGNGEKASDVRNVSSAAKIKVMGDMDVIIDEGATQVRVEADKNVIPYILTEMDGDWLEIKTKNNVSINTKHPIKVYITTSRITDVEVSGSGDVTSAGKFSADNKVSFKVSGSGDITFNVNAPRIETGIMGSGDLHLSGETRDVSVNVAGSGNYEGRELKAENAKVSIAGSGDANLFAEENLKVNIMGSGTVHYSGNAKVDKNIMGSGSVVKGD